MPAIQRRNWQYVHEGKNDGEECRLHPKYLPIPNGGEDASNRTETAEARRALLREDIFHIADVAFQGIHPKTDAGRKRFEETV